MSEAQARKFQRLAGEARKALSLANVFLEDGALMSAARGFREGADLLEQAQGARNAALGLTPTRKVSRSTGKR